MSYSELAIRCCNAQVSKGKADPDFRGGSETCKLIDLTCIDPDTLTDN